MQVVVEVEPAPHPLQHALLQHTRPSLAATLAQVDANRDLERMFVVRKSVL